jgi:hypothetical protein
MADLKAKRVLGGIYTPDDKLEVQLTYEGQAHSCVQWIELISGEPVTHGGGAEASSPLHYKSWDIDADSDGIIDYSSTYMTVVQQNKGTSVIKVVANVILKTTFDAFKTEHDAWVANYCTDTVQENGVEAREIADGAPSEPLMPEPTIYKSGEITLQWTDDNFV